MPTLLELINRDKDTKEAKAVAKAYENVEQTMDYAYSCDKGSDVRVEVDVTKGKVGREFTILNEANVLSIKMVTISKAVVNQLDVSFSHSKTQFESWEVLGRISGAGLKDTHDHNMFLLVMMPDGSLSLQRVANTKEIQEQYQLIVVK